MGIKHTKVSAVADSATTSLVRPTDWNDDHTIDGDVDVAGFAVTNVEDEAYNQTAWDGNLSVPTKNAIRDKIEALVLSGGGVTDFLALDDSPDSYAGYSGHDGFTAYNASDGGLVGVNLAGDAVAFRYGTDGRIDIRDYYAAWPPADWNIAPYLQAAIDANLDYGGTLYIPPTNPLSGYDSWDIIGPVTLPLPNFISDPIAGSAWSVQVAATSLYSDTTWTSPGNVHYYSTIARKSVLTNAPCGTKWVMDTGTNPGIELRNTDLFENFQLSTGAGPGILCKGPLVGQRANITIRDVTAQTSSVNANACPLVLDTCFWITVERCFFSASATNSYSVKLISTVNNGNGVSIGLYYFRDVLLAGGGILISPTEGNQPGNVQFHDLQIETMRDGEDFVTIDSTANSVTNLVFVRCYAFDSLGVSYFLKNTGIGTTQNIQILECDTSGLFNPAGDPIDFVEVQGVTYASSAVTEPYTGQYFGKDFWDTLDKKLIAAPRAPQQVIGTVKNVEQDPTAWNALCFAGSAATAGILAPDGSTHAGQINGNTGAVNGCEVFAATMTLAAGDWFVAGCWLQASVATELAGNAQLNFSFWTGSSAAVEINGIARQSSGEPVARSDYEEYKIGDGAWRWYCTAFKVTAIGTGDCNLSWQLQDGRTASNFFNPCLTYIPVADGYTDYDVINWARSQKGGWSSKALVGDVGILDHQRLSAGAIRTPRSTTLTIAAGVVTATGGYHLVDTEAAAASDDLDTISGGKDGMRIVIRAANSARTVVAKDATGNLQLAGDFSLDNAQDTLELIFDSALNAWLEIGRSDNGA